MTFVRFLLFIFVLISFACGHVDKEDSIVFQAGNHPELNVGIARPRRYLLYEVNPGEGFNLRRDVYMRIANLVYKLVSKKQDDWVLVLPPWGRIYHWQSRDIGSQLRIPWSHFFDVQSLNEHVPVIEFSEFLKETSKPEIEEIYYLQHYAEGWEDGKWEEKVDERPCNQEVAFHEDDSGVYRGWFWGYNQVYAKTFKCLSIQGHSSTLIPVLENSLARSILVNRAETILHDVFGDVLYWQARRSMRFAKYLQDAGDAFRLKFLNSTDDKDRTELSEDWRRTKKKSGSALGGPYVAVHLRRADFLYGHKDDVPSLKYAAKQIQLVLAKLNLTHTFLATDCSNAEFLELSFYLPNLVRYVPTEEDKVTFKDGGVAIIDQWICAHARYFIGTHESTFSFRIQEEREILGFHPDTTFNRLCPDQDVKCQQPSRWRLVYEGDQF